MGATCNGKATCRIIALPATGFSSYSSLCGTGYTYLTNCNFVCPTGDPCGGVLKKAVVSYRQGVWPGARMPLLCAERRPCRMVPPPVTLVLLPSLPPVQLRDAFPPTATQPRPPAAAGSATAA